MRLRSACLSRASFPVSSSSPYSWHPLSCHEPVLHLPTIVPSLPQSSHSRRRARSMLKSRGGERHGMQIGRCRCSTARPAPQPERRRNVKQSLSQSSRTEAANPPGMPSSKAAYNLKQPQASRPIRQTSGEQQSGHTKPPPPHTTRTHASTSKPICGTWATLHHPRSSRAAPRLRRV